MGKKKNYYCEHLDAKAKHRDILETLYKENMNNLYMLLKLLLLLLYLS